MIWGIVAATVVILLTFFIQIASAVGFVPHSENGTFVLGVFFILAIEASIVFGLLQMSRAVYTWIDDEGGGSS